MLLSPWNTAPEVLVVVDSEFVWVERVEALTHAQEWVVIEDGGEAEGAEELVEDALGFSASLGHGLRDLAWLGLPILNKNWGPRSLRDHHLLWSMPMEYYSLVPGHGPGSNLLRTLAS